MQKQIEEVMQLVDSYAHHERMQDSEASAQCREFVESKLRELLPVWQPIETAPKDGVEFISLIDGIPYLAFYDELGRFIRVTHSSREGFGRTWRIKEIDGREWKTLISEGEPARYEKNQIVWSDGFNFEPSHWMPLPKAPE